MSEPSWRDHRLSDIIEAQFVLFCHLAGALDRAGLVPRDFSAQTLRETAADGALRPGVRSCLRAIADVLERPDPGDDGPAWEPRVVAGGAGAGPGETAGETADPGAGSENGRAGNGASKNRRAGNGHAGNGGLPAGWRPTIVDDDDPDCT